VPDLRGNRGILPEIHPIHLVHSEEKANMMEVVVTASFQGSERIPSIHLNTGGCTERHQNRLGLTIGILIGGKQLSVDKNVDAPVRSAELHFAEACGVAKKESEEYKSAFSHPLAPIACSISRSSSRYRSLTRNNSITFW
jgi:hypothetical protein